MACDHRTGAPAPSEPVQPTRPRQDQTLALRDRAQTDPHASPHALTRTNSTPPSQSAPKSWRADVNRPRAQRSPHSGPDRSRSQEWSETLKRTRWPNHRPH
eukprot:152892-Pyramimonas_sp.AAC.1